MYYLGNGCKNYIIPYQRGQPLRLRGKINMAIGEPCNQQRKKQSQYHLVSEWRTVIISNENIIHLSLLDCKEEEAFGS